MTARNTYKFKIVLAFGISFLLTMLLITPASAVAQNGDPYSVDEFSLNTPGNLDVLTSGGHITVEASSGNTVRVEMYVRKNGRNLTPTDTDLNDFEIDISQTGNTVSASAERSNNRGWNFWNNNNTSISFVVYTPREMSSNLRTNGGHITTIGLDGNQEIRTSGGHLELTDLRGTVSARTSGGHITISQFEGNIEARTSGGHINVDNAEGDIDIRTSGGHITLDRTGGTVEARTSGGNINADLASIGQFVNLRTSGGNVSIRIPDQIGLNLALRGSSVRSNLQNFSGEIERDKINGTINGGGPQIAARTSGGRVSISFR